MQPTASRQKKLKKTNLLYNVVVGASSTVSTMTNGGGGSVCPNVKLTENVDYCNLLASVTDEKVCDNYVASMKYANLSRGDGTTAKYCDTLQNEIIKLANGKGMDIRKKIGTNQKDCEDVLIQGVVRAHETSTDGAFREYVLTQSRMDPRPLGMGNLHVGMAELMKNGLRPRNGMSVEEACEWAERMQTIESTPESIFMFELYKKWAAGKLIENGETEDIEMRSAMAAIMPALAALQELQPRRAVLDHLGPVMAQKFADSVKKCISPEDYARIEYTLRLTHLSPDQGFMMTQPLDDEYTKLMRDYAMANTKYSTKHLGDLFEFKYVKDDLNTKVDKKLSEAIVASLRGRLLDRCLTINEKNALLQDKTTGMYSHVTDLKDDIKTWRLLPAGDLETITDLLSGNINDTVEFYGAVDKLELATTQQFKTLTIQPRETLCVMDQAAIEEYCRLGTDPVITTMREKLTKMHPKDANLLLPLLEKCANREASPEDAMALALAVRTMCEAEADGDHSNHEEDVSGPSPGTIIGIAFGAAFISFMTVLGTFLAVRMGAKHCKRNKGHHHAVPTSEV